MEELWREDRDLFWKKFFAAQPWKENRSNELLLFVWKKEQQRLRQERRRAPRGHWADGAPLRRIYFEAVSLGARSVAEAFEMRFPGRIEEYWSAALPEAQREVVWHFWADQAQALGVLEAWEEAFSAAS